MGYEIVEVPAWAPHAAWIEAATGKVQEALGQIGKLESVGGLEAVEPQMLMRATRRR